MSINAEIIDAIEEIKAAFPEATVTGQPEPDGSAWVIVDGVDIGDQWEPQRTWVGFRIADGYPYADVYPHFIHAAVHLADDAPLPAAISIGHTFAVDQRPCLQVSRRSNRLNPVVDTAALKLVKVVHWLRHG